jgi:hypothetical protein
MKNLFFSFEKHLYSYLWLLALAAIFLFQAQIPGHVFNDNDPNIEQPTRESMSHFSPPKSGPFPMTITINDFDNFEMGNDYYEQFGSSNPNNPLWIFFGVNASGSPQNARGTTNGGLNWYLNNPGYPSGTCCDPWAAYTGNGVLIYASGVNGQYVYRSTNNGLTWSAPILSVSGYDRNHVEAEYTGIGPYANYVYACITPGNFGRSTDAGLTWTTTFTPSNSLPGCYICVGPNGSTNGGCVIYVTNTGSDASGSRIYNFYRSTNGGANFTYMSSDSGLGQRWVGTYGGGRHTINNARTAPHPKVAMDNSNGPYRGRLYFVNASNDPAGNGNKPDIWLRYSTDQGATWSARVRVNDNANPQASDQWFPEIWCEGTTGKLYIHWYDDRENPTTFQTAIYATYTTDGGQTFAPNQRLTNTTFTFPNPPCSPGCYRGDYTTITGNNPVCAFSIWSDHRSANAANMGAYFPDFAMRVRPTGDTLKQSNDSSFHYVTISSVKLWALSTKFSATVTPAPSGGSIIMNFLHKSNNTLLDSMTAYPDSLRLRVKTSGGVTAGFYTVTVKGNGPNGTPVHVRNITLLITDFVGITNNQVPADFSLYQNFPNPFNPSTHIKFELPKTGIVKITVYDITGKTVKVLADSEYEAGSHMVEFNGENLPSGVYFYKFITEGYIETKKMILLR